MLDLLILSSSIIFILLFYILGMTRVFLILIGVLLGYFIYLCFNFYLTLLTYIQTENPSFFDNLLLNNKGIFIYISFLSIFLIPLIFQIYKDSKIKNLYFSIVSGFFFPIFLVSILAGVISNSKIELEFYDNIYFLLNSSFIFNIFYENNLLLLLFIIIVIFLKPLYLFIKILIIFVKRFLLNFFKWFTNKEDIKKR